MFFKVSGDLDFVLSVTNFDVLLIVKFFLYNLASVTPFLC
jgi:hypothetical protein